MIGAGQLATLVHYPSVASVSDAEMIAVCDLDKQRLTETGEKYGIDSLHTDYREMLEKEEPDAVYAIGPPEAMYPIWVYCLERGLHLFIEKPMGLTIHQARALLFLAEKNECITQVGFQREHVRFLSVFGRSVFAGAQSFMRSAVSTRTRSLLTWKRRIT